MLRSGWSCTQPCACSAWAASLWCSRCGKARWRAHLSPATWKRARWRWQSTQGLVGSGRPPRQRTPACTSSHMACVPCAAPHHAQLRQPGCTPWVGCDLGNGQHGLSSRAPAPPTPTPTHTHTHTPHPTTRRARVQVDKGYTDVFGVLGLTRLEAGPALVLVTGIEQVGLGQAAAGGACL